MASTHYRGLDKPPAVPAELNASELPSNARFTILFQFLVQLSAYLLKIVDVVNNLLRGKINSTGTVTLTASVASMTLSDVNIGGNSVILFMPTTVNAKAEGTPYVTARAKGSCTLNFTNNAQVDRTYSYVVQS